MLATVVVTVSDFCAKTMLCLSGLYTFVVEIVIDTFWKNINQYNESSEFRKRCFQCVYVFLTTSISGLFVLLIFFRHQNLMPAESKVKLSSTAANGDFDLFL